MDWQPRLADGPTPIYVRLVEAIERDVESGTLEPGARLPPQRDLAHRLELSLGTVSRAYAEAERRGLILGHVGRGSFVAGGPATFGPSGPVDGNVDLARNIPPSAPAARRLAEALTALRSGPDLLAAAAYGPPEGLERIRAAAASWLHRRHGIGSGQMGRIVQCNGGQHGLALALGAVCRPGDAVLCEAGTFYGVRALADLAAYRLHGVAMDEQGLNPEALERAAAATGARVLYTVPTLQNPTGRTTGDARRRSIADLARRLDLWVVEDDAYRLYADRIDVPTLADLAPERTFHIASVSKGLCPGLRLGFLLPPDAHRRERVLRTVRATGYCPPALGGLVFAQWVESGAADTIADEVLAEMTRRTELARRVLGAAMAPLGAGRSLHAWLPMGPLEAERTAGRALRAGVEVTPPEAPILVPSEVSGLRVCLGAAPDMATLGWALDVVRAAIEGEVCEQSRAVI